jgi:Glycosyltransferase family 87
VRGILGERRFAALVPVLAFPAVFWTLGLGQNAFLTAALFGAGTLYIDRRPITAGLLFGTLCYEPHFGLLIPVALAAGGHWRAFAAAFAAPAALCSSSMMLFGWATWSDFFTAAAASHATYESGRVAFGGSAGGFRLALGLLPTDQGGKSRGGDPGRNPGNPDLRFNAGWGRSGLARPRPRRERPPGMGKSSAGRNVPVALGSARPGRSFALSDRAARRLGALVVVATRVFGSEARAARVATA